MSKASVRWPEWVMFCAKLDFIRRENLHALAPARNRDIPLLLIRRGFDRRIREQDVIHGLALGGVGRDGVAAHELAVIFRQHPAIIQSDASVGMNFLHRHQFAIGEPDAHPDFEHWP